MGQLSTKKQLIRAIESARARWDSLLVGLDEERITSPKEIGERSVKDVIAHLAAWEERPVAWLEAAQGREGVKPAEWPKGLDEDQTNAWIYAKNRDRPLGDVVAESERVHRRLVELVQALPEQDLTATNLVESLGEYFRSCYV